MASCGETVIRKGAFGESVSSLPPFEFSVLRVNQKGGREEMDFPKTPFWTTVSPHDAFSAPLVRSDKREE